LKTERSFPVNDHTAFRIQMLNWCNRFNIFCFLDNPSPSAEFKVLAGAGAAHCLSAPAGTAFQQLRDFYKDKDNEWLFGHFGYDLKNETEQLSSSHPDHIGFSDLHFFIPQTVLRLYEHSVSIYTSAGHEDIFSSISREPVIAPGNTQHATLIRHRISREAYIDTIHQLQQHIRRGDCYEINFCQEFYATDTAIDPLQVYEKLVTVSPNPFAVLYRVNDRYCLCASPERYLKKKGERVLSQPIKGTSKRDLLHSDNDEAQKKYLLTSEKERSENVMIVDLVRNDLSRVCSEGSVRVDELFGLYSFPQVHQMISTVSGILQPGLNWVDAVAATFPMGSMTGAPKKRVMELAEQYEKSRRGLFSGAIGYVEPGGDFDFNVVIRSLFYNAETQYLSFQAGGAITFHSKAEEEYEECLLKAAAIRKVLQ